ncbi:methyltransferase domain-containing protein [Streptomyces sp. NPDC057137]|uniref:methyltransferase domain-containing protein n=1 Tax=Streptomyces sp. NPDC057137 TaxID=3346030 RepID=UPI00363C097B
MDVIRNATVDPSRADSVGLASALDRRRLVALEELWDAGSAVLLGRLGIRPDWRCLELGAGTGSIARWLARRCPRGQVTATDVDLRFLSDPGHPDLKVMFHDAVEGPDFPEGSFDLLHSRAVLTHLPDRREVIARAVRWLAPGGWLVLEELAAFPAESSPSPLFRRVLAAYTQAMSYWLGTDLRWSRDLPGVLGEAGLTDLGLDVRVMVVGDGGAGEEFWRICLQQAGPAMVAEGLLTAEDLVAATAQLDEADFLDAPLALVSAWGRKP